MILPVSSVPLQELWQRMADAENSEANLGLRRVIQAEGAFADFWDGLAFEVEGVAVAEGASERTEVVETLGADGRLVEQTEKAMAAGTRLFH